MSVLKIGVLTFHRCINYGSYWQARCLVEGLQSRGHNVELLDHESGRVNIAEWKCAMQPLLPTPVPVQDRPLYRSKINRFFEVFDTMSCSPRFQLDHPHTMDNYDLVVVGSDEVWNLSHPWYGKCPLFYGDGVKAKRLISYAASFGNHSASWGLPQEWANKLRNFDRISVRDENSRTIVENAIGLKPEMVLDPCLQFPIVPDERESSYGQKPYVAVYGHNFSESYIQKVKGWAHSRSLPLISIGYGNTWADEQWITADPHDFVHFIRKSKAVVTNFFHGCVFAIQNNKPFVCETSPYRSYKVQGLMAKVGGEKHLIWEDTPAATLNTHLDAPIDPQIIQKIDLLRQSSNKYIDDALGVQQMQYA